MAQTRRLDPFGPSFHDFGQLLVLFLKFTFWANFWRNLSFLLLNKAVGERVVESPLNSDLFRPMLGLQQCGLLPLFLHLIEN
jgi:hypothetical protein